MSLIKDVKHDLDKLDLSIISLKKFGITVGSVFILISIWFLISEIFVPARMIIQILGIFLILSGLVIPGKLKSVYIIWMGFALILGWFVSRFILTLIFFLVITPTAIIAKIVGKEFMDISREKKSTTYWKTKTYKTNYEKMF